MSRYTLDNLRELPEDAPVRDVAAALDLDVPGWEQKVDLDTLDMHEGSTCVAGQIAKSWRTTIGWERDGYEKFIQRMGGSAHSLAAFDGDQFRRPAWLTAIRARLRRTRSTA